jgi:hypothetical protein
LEEDVAQIATEVKTSLFQGGQDHGCLAAVISKEECRLEVMDNTYTYVEPLGQALPAYNPNITGNEDEYAIKALEAEHKVYRTDRLRYEVLTEHINDELLKSRVSMRHGSQPSSAQGGDTQIFPSNVSSSTYAATQRS